MLLLCEQRAGTGDLGSLEMINDKAECRNKKPVKIVIPAVILVAGIVMMFFGILRGEPQMIFQKAIRICLECIGIG